MKTTPQASFVPSSLCLCSLELGVGSGKHLTLTSSLSQTQRWQFITLSTSVRHSLDFVGSSIPRCRRFVNPLVSLWVSHFFALSVCHWESVTLRSLCWNQ
ncbi:hypothetical protein HN51_015716 [Arachis hypogaea]